VHALRKTFVLVCLTAGVAFGGPISLFQGTFATDDQVELFSFSLSATTLVTLQSFGYAGGTVGPTTIAAGGFAPNVALFVLVGSDYVPVNNSYPGGPCPPANVDPVSGNCEDPYINIPLGAGSYFLGLSVADNLPLGNLADGYKQTGNPGFTCAEGGVSGNFCDVTDPLYLSRTGNWAFAFTGAGTVTDVSTPEPSSSGLMLSSCLLGALLLGRKS